MARKPTEHRRRSSAIAVTECRRRLKAKAVALKGGKCARCGFEGIPAVYDFHHLDPTQKDFRLSGGVVKSFARMQKELEKTVLLCANCHRVVHDELFQQSFAVRKEQLAVARMVTSKGGRPPTIAWPPDSELIARLEVSSRAEVEKDLECSKNALWKHLRKIEALSGADKSSCRDGGTW